MARRPSPCRGAGPDDFQSAGPGARSGVRAEQREAAQSLKLGRSSGRCPEPAREAGGRPRRAGAPAPPAALAYLFASTRPRSPPGSPPGTSLLSAPPGPSARARAPPRARPGRKGACPGAQARPGVEAVPRRLQHGGAALESLGVAAVIHRSGVDSAEEQEAGASAGRSPRCWKAHPARPSAPGVCAPLSISYRGSPSRRTRRTPRRVFQQDFNGIYIYIGNPSRSRSKRGIVTGSEVRSLTRPSKVTSWVILNTVTS